MTDGPGRAARSERGIVRSLLRTARNALRPFAPSATSRVAAVWDKAAGTWKIGGGLHWTELPRVQARINRMVSGDPAVDPYLHLARTRFPDRLPLDRALTIGCGAGELERGLTQYGFCLRHEAFDVAGGAIGRAREAARAAGLDHIVYDVRDGNTLELEQDAYDCIFGVHAIHHLEALERVFAAVRAALRPDGLFVLNEFVGPTRFQWTDAQLEAANRLLAATPERLRVSCRDGRTVRRCVQRPTIAEMISMDASEAIRSAEILPLLPEYFEILETRGQGGAVLHLVLDEIAGNFRDGDDEAVEWLERCFAEEDRLLASGEVGHDFAFVVARRPR